MKASANKNRRWMTMGLTIMLLALLSFSLLPLVTSIVQSRQSPVANANNPPQALANLNNQALGYQLVLEREPDNQNALRGLLEVKLQQQNLAEAIAPLSRLAQLNPQIPDYGILLAQSKQQLQDYEGAAAAYRTVLATNPNEMRALKGMVELLTAQNRTPEAINLVQKSLDDAIAQKQTTDAYGLTSRQLLLGEIFLQQKRYADATTIYDNAIQAAPQDFRPVLAKAIVLREQGKQKEAEILLQQATNLAPIQYKEQLKTIALNGKDTEEIKEIKK